MSTRGENGGAQGLSAKADILVDSALEEADTAVDVSEDDVAERVLRVLQLHDDARLEFDRAEEKLKSVRQTFDRVLAGDAVAVDVAPVIPNVEVIPAVVTPKRRPYLAVSAVVAGLAIMAGLVMLFAGAMRDPDPSAARGTIVSEAVAAIVPARDEPAPAAVTVDQTDLGQTIYAERFAKAPAAEQTCLARAVYYEARGEDMAGQIAVAQVVLNRARSKKWPNTICGVVNQGIERGEKCQFSFACFSHLSGPSGEMWDQAQQVADQALGGQAWLRELVDATYYHTTSVAPVWRLGLSEVATIGTHVFYRDGDGVRANAHDAKAYEAAAQALRAKVARVTRAARPKTLTGNTAAGAPKKGSVGNGGDWKATVFSQ